MSNDPHAFISEGAIPEDPTEELLLIVSTTLTAQSLWQHLQDVFGGNRQAIYDWLIEQNESLGLMDPATYVRRGQPGDFDIVEEALRAGHP
jgi:hypothetical protein